MPIKKQIVYSCPICDQVWTYTATDYQMAVQDDCCHECVVEEDDEDDGAS